MRFTQIAAIAFIGTSAAFPLSTLKVRQTAKADPVSVQLAADSFKRDATVVSQNLNSLGTETDPTNINALATKAFSAESDENAQRAVLALAAGSSAAQSNQLIMDNTPTVLNGLSAIMADPTPQTANTQLQSIEAAR